MSLNQGYAYSVDSMKNSGSGIENPGQEHIEKYTLQRTGIHFYT